MKRLFKKFYCVDTLQLLCAVFVTIGCFLDFPNDPQLCGIFWLVTSLTILFRILTRRKRIRRKEPVNVSQCRTCKYFPPSQRSRIS